MAITKYQPGAAMAAATAGALTGQSQKEREKAEKIHQQKLQADRIAAQMVQQQIGIEASIKAAEKTRAFQKEMQAKQEEAVMARFNMGIDADIQKQAIAHKNALMRMDYGQQLEIQDELRAVSKATDTWRSAMEAIENAEYVSDEPGPNGGPSQKEIAKFRASLKAYGDGVGQAGAHLGIGSLYNRKSSGTDWAALLDKQEAESETPAPQQTPTPQQAAQSEVSAENVITVSDSEGNPVDIPGWQPFIRINDNGTLKSIPIDSAELWLAKDGVEYIPSGAEAKKIHYERARAAAKQRGQKAWTSESMGIENLGYLPTQEYDETPKQRSGWFKNVSWNFGRNR